MSELRVTAPDGLPEVVAGADLAALVAEATELRDGDVVAVTSKVVSKAEGRVVVADDEAREEALVAETRRVVARRGPVRIVRNRLGLIMAAAGIDRSNVRQDSIVLLPLDPDASARRLRRELRERTGANVGVLVTDTAGRPWREGQTDVAIGLAGLLPAEPFAGRTDAHGNPLAVTLPAVADELAGAAELAQGKLGGRPVAVLRGRPDLVLPPDDDGPGAVALQRPEGADLFGWGAREAVLAALAGRPEDQAPFGAAVDLDELVEALDRVGVEPVEPPAGSPEPTARPGGPDDPAVELVLAGTTAEVVRAVCFSHGWVVHESAVTESGLRLRLSPRTP